MSASTEIMACSVLGRKDGKKKRKKKGNKNQKSDPLRAMKTFISKKVGHTS